MKKNILLGVIAVSVFLLLPGCSPEFTQKTTETNKESALATEKDEAVAAADQYYEKLTEKNYMGAMTFYSEVWYKDMTPYQTEEFLKNLDTKLGAVKTHTLESSEVSHYENVTSEEGNGWYVNLKYKVEREQYHSEETLIFFKASDDKPSLIKTHDVRSEGFDKK